MPAGADNNLRLPAVIGDQPSQPIGLRVRRHCRACNLRGEHHQCGVFPHVQPVAFERLHSSSQRISREVVVTAIPFAHKFPQDPVRDPLLNRLKHALRLAIGNELDASPVQNAGKWTADHVPATGRVGTVGQIYFIPRGRAAEADAGRRDSGIVHVRRQRDPDEVSQSCRRRRDYRVASLGIRWIEGPVAIGIPAVLHRLHIAGPPPGHIHIVKYIARGQSEQAAGRGELARVVRIRKGEQVQAGVEGLGQNAEVDFGMAVITAVISCPQSYMIMGSLVQSEPVTEKVGIGIVVVAGEDLRIIVDLQPDPGDINAALRVCDHRLNGRVGTVQGRIIQRTEDFYLRRFHIRQGIGHVYSSGPQLPRILRVERVNILSALPDLSDEVSRCAFGFLRQQQAG